MKLFTKHVIQLIQMIPEGKVMTYGQIACYVGSPRAARQVVRILHSMSEKYQLPWHRVVNSKGEIAIKDDELYQIQRLSLESEGVMILPGNKVDLSCYQFEPNEVDSFK